MSRACRRLLCRRVTPKEVPHVSDARPWQRLTPAAKWLLEEMEATALLAPDGQIEPPSEALLMAMLALSRSDRTELAAGLGGMVMGTLRRAGQPGRTKDPGPGRLL